MWAAVNKGAAGRGCAGDTRCGCEESGAIDRARGVLVRSTPAALAHQPRNIYVYVNIGCSHHSDHTVFMKVKKEN